MSNSKEVKSVGWINWKRITKEKAMKKERKKKNEERMRNKNKIQMGDIPCR